MASVTVDLIAGLASSNAVKGPCRAATTANISLAGQQTINGVAVVDGDRVLVKNQTNTADNGIYVASTGDWARAPDFSRTDDVRAGTQVYVTDGTNIGMWFLSTTGTITIGTTGLAFSNLTATLVLSAFATEDVPVTGGVVITEKALGTVSSGTLTPDPGDRAIQTYTNNGAHILAPHATNKGTYVLAVTNGAAAGAVTLSGWTKVIGAFSTTNGAKFHCIAIITSAGSTLSIQPLA